MTESIKIGTRGSPMALFQANTVQRQLAKAHPDKQFEIVIIKTEGDQIQGDLKEFGGKGLFVRAIDEQMLSGAIDLSVSSLKDVPHDGERGGKIRIGAVLERDDIRDSLLCRPGVTEEDLRTRTCRIGTSAPRRAAALRKLYPLCEIVPIRGTAETRIRKLGEGEADATLLATAGLHRVGETRHITRTLEVNEVMPAAGSAVVTIDALVSRTDLEPYLASLNHAPTLFQVHLERGLVNKLEGNSHTAISAHTKVQGSTVTAHAIVYSEDGSQTVERTVTGTTADDPNALGQDLAATLLEGGAAELIASQR